MLRRFGLSADSAEALLLELMRHKALKSIGKKYKGM